MENTPENKAIFLRSCIGEYLFEENISEMKTWHIHSVDMNGVVKVIHTKDDMALVAEIDDIVVAKKPLSHISDEDAIEVGKIQAWWQSVKYKSLKCETRKDNFLISHAKNDIQQALLELKNNKNDFTMIPSSYDYLRSKGYALPFNGVSVETLIERGWIKLKKYNNTRTTTNITC